MSEEAMQQSGSAVSTLKSAMILPGAQFTFGAATSLKRAKGSVKEAIKNIEVENFKKLNTVLKNGTHKDVFSRGMALGENYDKFRTLQKNAYKTGKKASKLAEKTKLPLFDRFRNLSSSLSDKFKNLFKIKSTNNKITLEAKQAAAKKLSEESAKEYAEAKSAIAAGKEIAETAAESGFKNTAKHLFKKEMTSKFNLALSALTTFVPAMNEKIIPAFKEKGIFAGIKETGKALIRTASDFVAYGFGGAIGRAAGYALGAFLAPVTGGISAMCGGMLGDILGSLLIGGKVCNKVDEIVGEKKEDADTKTQQSADTISQQSQQINSYKVNYMS